MNMATLGYAALGGVMSVLQGGKFGHGFVSAGLGSIAGAKLGPIFNAKGFSVPGLIASSVIGGTVSELSGGKFANGARSAAFSYMVSWGASKIEAGGRVEEVGGDGQSSQEGKVNKSLSDNIRRDENGNLVLDITVGAETGQEEQRDLLVKKVNGKFEGKGGCNFLGFGCDKSQSEYLIVNATAVDGSGDITVYSRATMSVLAPDTKWASSSFCKWACATTGGNNMHINSMSMSGDKYLHEVFHNFGLGHSNGLMGKNGGTLTSKNVNSLGALYGY